MMRAHGLHADHYLWANRTSCLCCMQEFHSTKRLSAHFQHGGFRCLQQLKLRYQHPQVLLDEHRGGDMQHVPFAPVAGPVEEWCQQMVDEHRGWIRKPRRARRLPLMPRQRAPDAPLSKQSFPTCFVFSEQRIPRHIPMPTQFILHFFSGRRRTFDLQSHLEKQASELHKCIRVLSLDVAIDGALGNLATDQAYHFWVDKCLRGFIHSFMAGPPCETFTRARFKAGGPPPLRSKAYRWGLPGLLGRNHHQVESGSYLWRFTASMLAAQLKAGKGGIFEHPAPFDTSDGPCRGGIHTWEFPEICTLLQWPTLELHLVDQGKFGQVSRKPTGFMVLNHSKAASLFQEWPLPPHLWQMHGVTVGWDAEAKRFATAPLKEYPDRLNGCLASILLSEVDSPATTVACEGGDDLFQRFVGDTSHLCQALEQCDWGTLQPDWYRG